MFAAVLAGLTLFLVACGIKGPLYLPPTATSPAMPSGKAAPDAPAVTPAADVNAQPEANPESEVSPESEANPEVNPETNSEHGDTSAPAQEAPPP
jgi:predicted small lipoprotein YifL